MDQQPAQSQPQTQTQTQPQTPILESSTPPLVPAPPEKTSSPLGLRPPFIIAGALLIIIIGVIITIVIVKGSTPSGDTMYETSQKAISKAATELQQQRIPTISVTDQKLKEIDTDLTQIDQENQEIDQGIKDSLPDLSVQ